MELKPGKPVFVKEVHGNIWKTGIIDQPAKEPKSYWVKFPDNSILRRTRSMTKPWSQPSYFKLEAEGKDRNRSGHIPAKLQHTFNSNPQTPEIPALPMASLVLPSLTSKATPTEQGQIPTSSIPVAARKAVTQWFPPLQDSQPAALKEFHQWGSLQPRSDYVYQWNIMDASGKVVFMYIVFV